MLTDHAPEWNGTAVYLRGSCTDPHWGSNCPDFCVASMSSVSSSSRLSNVDDWTDSTTGNAVSNDCTSDEKPSFCCGKLKDQYNDRMLTMSFSKSWKQLSV